MTKDDHTSNPSSSSTRVSEQELRRYLTEYRPTTIDPQHWADVADEAAELVLRAGVLTKDRVRKDMVVVSGLVAHLVERDRPISLHEALSDQTLLTFDASLGAARGTRENKRGAARRLQAVHGGLPWRAKRHAVGARASASVPTALLDALAPLLGAARQSAGEDRDAAAFVTVVEAARQGRRSGTGLPALDAGRWKSARQFAASQGASLTQNALWAALTLEVLGENTPVAVLIDQCNLTRRDLELALGEAAALPDAPGLPNHLLLRGPRDLPALQQCPVSHGPSVDAPTPGTHVR